jgi:flagellar hook protein FlgE
MIRSLLSAVSGILNLQTRMDVIGNNVANVNTTGFKSGRTDFADSFSQTLRASSAGNGGGSGLSAIQVGTGVTTSSIKNLYTQGALTRTGVATDLGISGEGFFVVRDPLSSAQYATRAGDFRLDQNGYLITNAGHRVQGFSDAALTALGDIRIDTTGMPVTSDPAARMISFTIDIEGQVNVQLSDGTQFVRGQVLLQNFLDPQGLIKEGGNLYSNLGAAGPLDWSANPGRPGSNGLGRVEAEALELANVDLATEFTNLIVTQRAYQANARIITTSDEMLAELVNLKR